MADTPNFSYIGTELDLFSLAKNWKSYWSRTILPYIGTNVLDVGAGKGATAQLLAGAPDQRWLALEPDSNFANSIRADVASGRIAANCDVRTGTLEALDSREIFDTILYIDVLEHIEDDKGELARAARHLAPTGRIIALSPAHNSLFTPFDKALGHFRRYNKGSLSAATPQGLVVDKMFYLDSVGMLASLGNRLFLQANKPTASQIRIWDNLMVPVSRIVDPLTANLIGKSIVGIWKFENK